MPSRPCFRTQPRNARCSPSLGCLVTRKMRRRAGTCGTTHCSCTRSTQTAPPALTSGTKLQGLTRTFLRTRVLHSPLPSRCLVQLGESHLCCFSNRRARELGALSAAPRPPHAHQPTNPSSRAHPRVEPVHRALWLATVTLSPVQGDLGNWLESAWRRCSCASHPVQKPH